MENLATAFLQATVKHFKACKKLGDKTFEQIISDEDFYYTPNNESNSLAIIIQHMSGNMLSRWTNFLTEDGEKDWRNRDTEFEPHSYTKQQLLANWDKGWQCLFTALEALTEADMEKTIYIRHEGQEVIDAILRQLAHYASHVGQIVYVGKLIKNEQWQSLSIPKAKSQVLNNDMKKIYKL